MKKAKFNRELPKGNEEKPKSGLDGMTILYRTGVVVLSGSILFLLILLIYPFFTYKPHVAEAKPVKPNHVIQIEILNGCGIGGIGTMFTDFLRDGKFDVITTGNYYMFDVDKTLVIDRKGDINSAYAVAEFLGVNRENVIQQLNPNYFLDVSIIVGKDYIQLKPAQRGNIDTKTTN